MPNIIGYNYNENKAQIEAILKAEGYELGSVSEEESDEPVGVIINQDPGADSSASKGSAINIVISKGTDKSKMPSLLGMTFEEAKAALEAAGFEVGTPTYEESSVYAKGIVMDQPYEPGAKIEKGTVISLVISKGEPAVTPPDEPEEPEDPGDSENPDGSGGQGGESENPDEEGNADDDE